MDIEWESKSEVLVVKNGQSGQWEVVFSYANDDIKSVSLALYGSSETTVRAVGPENILFTVKDLAHAERIIRAIEGDA